MVIGAISEWVNAPVPDHEVAAGPAADGEAPLVSVIIPCRNEARHIERCLRDVLAFEPTEGGFEMIVSDGLSTDGTRDILRRLAEFEPRLRLLDNPERTTPCALNSAIRAARGRIIVRIDAHTEYAPDYLSECVRVMRETGADNVGGPARTRAHSYVQRAIAAAYHSRFAVGNGAFHQVEYEGPADTVPYGCYDKDRLFGIGLFDPELVRNQDDELNFRLLRAGGRIWQSPGIRSWYQPRGSLHQLFLQYAQYGYWKVRVMQKHGAPASWRHVVPGSFVFTLLVLALGSPVIPAARYPLTVLLTLYGAGLVAASLQSAARHGLDLLPVLPATFACYHMGYGLGFLAGIWDFLLLRRGGRLVRLTRH